MRRRLVAVAAALAVAGLMAAAAQAAVWLTFSKARAQPGELVSVRTAGNGALAGAREQPVRAYLAPTSSAAEIRSRRDPRLKLLGRLRVDQAGTGRLRAPTPNLAPGEYTTFVHCPDCAQFSNGRSFFRSGPSTPFSVTPLLRDCRSRQTGELPTDWRRRSVQAGPIALYPVPAPAPARVRNRPGRFRPVKVLVIVRPGERATLQVPAATRPYVGLLYGHGAVFGSYKPVVRPRDGLTAVTFASCTEGRYPDDHFGGGFAVSRAMCAHLEVRVAGRADPLPLDVAFGRSC